MKSSESNLGVNSLVDSNNKVAIGGPILRLMRVNIDDDIVKNVLVVITENIYLGILMKWLELLPD